MAQVAGTTDTYDVGSGGGLREDLEDVIWDLFPMDTYCVSNFPKVKASATLHEWLIDATAAVAANRQIEGDDASFATIVAPTRMGNYCQISRKTFLISRTMESVDKAGRKSELARQGMKQMKELKRDMESAVVTNQASSAGGHATARSLGSIESWLATTDNGGNGVRATTTASASTLGFTSGAVTAPTDGSTTGALTEAKFREAISLAWADGGDPSVILVGSTQKQAISAFSGVATKYNEVKGRSQADIIGASDYYVSDFGNHEIVLSRYARASVVLCLDPEYWAIAQLDAPFMEKLAKTGDGDKRQLIAEFTLVARNPNASAKVVACS